MKVSQIKVGERARKDLGDLEPLINSIKAVGLLHPIVVAPDGTMIAGYRRLEAFKRMGLQEIPATILDVKDILRAEYDENVIRKDFTIEERVEIAEKLWGKVAEEARKRQEATQFSETHQPDKENNTTVAQNNGGGNFPPPSSKGKTRDIIAKFFDESGKQLEKERKIVEAVKKEPEKFGNLLEKIDRGEVSVDYAYQAVKRVETTPEKRKRIENKLKRLHELENEGVILSTIWDIGERASYAGSGEFHGNCPPQVVEQCVLRLTKKGDVVLDPMAGSGTSIDVCNILGRKCIAYDLKPSRNDIIQHDSRTLPLNDNSVDMVFLHPPYWNLVSYTMADEKESEADLSRAPTIEKYFDMLRQVIEEAKRILKPGKFLCLLIGDMVREGKFIPLCRKAANLCEEAGFQDAGYAVKITRNSTSTIVKGKVLFAELAYTGNLKIEHDLVMFFKKV